MSKTTHANFTITGMHCAGCASTVEDALKSAPGVERVQVNFAIGSASVEYRADTATAVALIAEVVRAGYGARLRKEDDILDYESEIETARREFYTAATIIVPLVLIHMTMDAGTLTHVRGANATHVWPMILVAALSTVALAYSGREILRDALTQTLNRRANMNSLIALGAVSSYLFSIYNLGASLFGASPLSQDLYFETSAVIILFVLLGRFLESRARARTKRAIAELLALRPSKATAIINGVEIEIDAASARPPMELLVRPGDATPADGVVVDGAPSIDESLLTGESLPVEKNIGDSVIGGSINGSKAFRMRVTASGEESYLASVIRLVSDAQNTKAPVQKLADRIAGVFTPIVALIAVVTAVAWFIFGGEERVRLSFAMSLAVIIIACPCALGLATPTAILAGIGRAARRGIFFKGGDVVERVAVADTIVFDKTGTLTIGKPTVVAVEAVGGVTLDEILRVAVALESASEHPLGRGICDYASHNGQYAERASAVEAISGFGVRGTLDGASAIIGNLAVLERERIDPDPARAWMEAHSSRGHTLAIVAHHGRVIGALALADTVRPEAHSSVQRIIDDGYRVYMFTGDNRRAAKAIADSLGVKHIEAEMTPSQKCDAVRALGQAGAKVIMIGDGINDAPALAAADTGMAMGAGAGVAKEAADVILVRPQISDALIAIDMAKLTMRVIKQNLFWAFAYNIIAIPIAAGVFYSSFGWRLTPEIGAFTMAMSSVLVVSNSARLLGSRGVGSKKR